ncbi:MAG: FAD-dependent oxidoreductase [Candidatus Nanohaloarchaea archaeon]|nr:FAD-dependent oxidoreductase [Candidatus Nanohaloarchaea archaeon]
MSGIVVAGGGIAGLEAALRLDRRTACEITVVDPGTATTFYPSLHRVLQGKPIDAVSIDFDAVFDGRDIDHVQEEVAGMAPEERRLELAAGSLDFDKCVVTVGARTSYGSIEGGCNVHDLRFRDDTEAVAEAVENGAVDRIVVVGGGATGVEAAASLYEASDGLERFDIALLEGENRLLPQFDPSLGQIVETAYRRRGIDIRTEAFVERIRADGVVLQDGEDVSSDVTVWAGGIEPRPVIQEFGLEYTDDGIPVDEHMRAADDVYVAGDAASYDGKVNRAFYAIGEAKTAAANIARSLAGKQLQRHRMGWDPNLVHLGAWDALFELDGYTWRGRTPALMRSIGVEQRYLWTRRHLL